MHHQSVISPVTTERTLLILLAGIPYPATLRKYGDYHTMFQALFEKVLKRDSVRFSGIQLRIKSYKVLVLGQPADYPTEADLAGAHGLLVTGGGRLAYGSDAARCRDFLATAYRTHPHLRFFGVCSGHQLIGHALGGKAEQHTAGQELGCQRVRMSDAAKRFLEPWLPGRNTFNIAESHGAQLILLPPNSCNVGETDHTACQGILLPCSATDVSQLRVFTVQGHPEYTAADMMEESIRMRLQKGQISRSQADEARTTISRPSTGVALACLMLAMKKAAPL